MGMPGLSQRNCRDAQLSSASNTTFLKRKRSAAFCFVIVRLLVCHPSAESLWLGVSPNLSKRRQFNISRVGEKTRVHQNWRRRKGLMFRRRLPARPGVSVGTLSHALEVLRTGDPEIVRALCNGEIKIDRAWRWCKEHRSQERENLKLYRRNRGMERVAEKLVARQARRMKRIGSHKRQWHNATSTEAVRRLAALTPDELNSVDVIFIKAPISVIALSVDIGQHLGFQEETPP